MIKLKKIYIDNFKGVDGAKTVDIDNGNDTQINILSGPNGFGKSTIFEAIEFCLTGQLNKVFLYQSVQHGTSDRVKPHFQNTDGKDVIIKLLIENTETSTYHTIIKHYDDVSAPTKPNSRKYNPVDNEYIIRTYYSDTTELFSTSDFAKDKQLVQKDVDRLIYGDAKLDLQNVYYLFNYIQQEDNLYFLKKSEKEKGEALSFLFNIEKEQAEYSKLSTLSVALKNKHSELVDKIKYLEAGIIKVDTIHFERLFAHKDFGFDSQNLFNGTHDENKRQLDAFISTLSKLVEFRNKFSVQDYLNSVNFKRVNEEILNDNKLLQSIVLSKIYNPEQIDPISEKNKLIKEYNNFKSRKDKNSIPADYITRFLDDGALKDYQAHILENQSIDRDLGVVGKVISDLIESRNKSMKEFEKLKTQIQTNDNNCPLCDQPYSSYEDLLAKVALKTQDLNQYSEAKLKRKSEILGLIATIATRIEEKIDEYLINNMLTDEVVISNLRSAINYHAQSLRILERFNQLKLPEAESLLFDRIPNNAAEIEFKVEALKQYFKDHILPTLFFDSEKIVDFNFFDEYFNKDKEYFESINAESISNKIKYLKGEFNLKCNSQLLQLNKRKEQLEATQKKLDPLVDILKQTIREHKIEMIEKIKIPFYIYSGKILQNYQQGMGIFVSINDANNHVNFITGSKSDHNIVHHLSSGQMAVVSIAFCLSLNKVYNTNKNFKFLAVDDPIQAMDDINVHTFIELIRHEFQDYQLLMSTHDEFISKYMKYKFDKFNLKTRIQNVQSLFFRKLDTPSDEIN